MSKRPRRQQARSPEDEAGPEKKILSTPSTAGAVWEWEGDGGVWNAYNPEHSKTLSEALGKKEKVRFTVASKVTMEVSFRAMTQVNVATKWKRNIRCVSSSPASSSSSSSASSSSSSASSSGPEGEVLWEWEGEDGTWTAYSTATQRLLMACRVCAVQSVKVEGDGGRVCVVHLATMKQAGVRGGQKKNVRCSQIAAWQWQNEHGQWMNYDPSVATELERERTGASRGGKVPIVAAERSYTVDLGRMEQMNDDTGVCRNVRRIKPSTTANKTTVEPKATPTTTTTKATPTTTKTTPTTTKATPSTTEATPSTSEDCTKSSDGTSHVIRKFQGKVPVDLACTQKIVKAHVYIDEEGTWDAMLNQTNLKNNNNKFYLLQLLKDSSTHRYCTWFRWGRVGKTGQHNLTECGSDLEKAKDVFMKKFSDKTLNSWSERKSFVKHPGKYDFIRMDYEAKEETDAVVQEEEEEEEEEEEKEKEEEEVPHESKLDKRLQSLIELICDVQAMEDAVVEMKYDAKKAPLGKLTKDQILSGYAALKKIDECIAQGKIGEPLVHACDQFYTRIPHDFGMRRPPIIRTKQEVREKISLLEALGDIEVAMKVLRGGDKTEHPLDRHYHELQCKLQPIDTEDKAFQLVEKYVRQTHAKTHNQYTLAVEDVFVMDKEGEEEVFKDVGNRYLLWHGSRLTNWVGILRQSLRVAPPEAPVTGYMFGKGVYFADMCSKSANYCFSSPARNESLLVLCDVALGQTNDLLAADYTADKLPRGKHSTRGLGKIAPNPSQNEILSSGCIVPLGTATDTGVCNPHGYTLNYNEFVIYDTKQIKMKYLVRVKFNFK